MNAEELGRILDELGERLGPTGAYVFELAVRQVYIDAVVAAISAAVVLVVGAVAARPLYRWVQDNPSFGSRDMAGVLLAGGYAVALVSVLGWALIAVPNAFNPEYAALRGILGAIGGVR